MVRLIALEGRRLFRERVGWIVLLVMTIATVTAVVQGRAALHEQERGRAAFLTERAEADKAIAQQIAEATAETAPILPRRATLPILAPVPRLADFSMGRTGFENYATTIRLGLREDSLFNEVRLDNPEILARGGIDLGFVAIAIMPLLLVGLGYGVFTADRDSGVARAALAQGPAIRLLIARSLPRLAIVFAPLLLAAGWLLLEGPSIEHRLISAVGWLSVALLLGLFWWSLVLLVNSFRLSAESAALLLISVWAVVTLILPPLISAAAQVAYPPPSRLEQIAVSRAAELAATNAFENDHPELTEAAAERRRQAERAVEIDRQAEAAIAPISARFEDRRARQRSIVEMLSFLSPTLVAANAGSALAGTDGGTWLAFRSAASAYLAESKQALRAILLSDRPLTLSRYQALPSFRWQPPVKFPLTALLYLAGLTLVIGAIAHRRFRNIELA